MALSCRSSSSNTSLNDIVLVNISCKIYHLRGKFRAIERTLYEPGCRYVKGALGRACIFHELFAAGALYKKRGTPNGVPEFILPL
jgi:hypothetical protein